MSAPEIPPSCPARYPLHEISRSGFWPEISEVPELLEGADI